MPASTINPLIGRLRFTIPVSSCGASRVNVAAAVNDNAPSPPIMKPSRDSRRVESISLTITAGVTARIAAPSGTPMPSRIRRDSAIPPRSGTP